MENLNKENFWNGLHREYQQATELFCNWIDDYKKEINWTNLFNPFYKPVEDSLSHECPKFHDLPLALQLGILQVFAEENKTPGYYGAEYFIPKPNFSNQIEAAEHFFLVLNDHLTSRP